MNGISRRKFLGLTPAFPATAAVTLTLNQKNAEPVSMDASVLKLQKGDTLVISCHGPVSAETAYRIKAHVEHSFPGIKAILMSDGLKLEGVLR